MRLFAQRIKRRLGRKSVRSPKTASVLGVPSLRKRMSIENPTARKVLYPRTFAAAKRKKERRGAKTAGIYRRATQWPPSPFRSISHARIRALECPFLHGEKFPEDKITGQMRAARRAQKRGGGGGELVYEVAATREARNEGGRRGKKRRKEGENVGCDNNERSPSCVS